MDRLTFEGYPVSNGVGVGEIAVFEPMCTKVNTGIIKETQVEDEIGKLEFAVNKTLAEFCELKDSFENRLKKEESMILEVYKAILEDKQFIEEVKDVIGYHKYHADNAVQICINNYISLIERSDNEYIKQNMDDLKDVGCRIMRNIPGSYSSLTAFDKGYCKKIVVLKELSTSLAATLGSKKVRGIAVADNIGYLSHAAIILRGLGIPTLVQTDFETIRQFAGKPAIIDGDDGNIIVNPKKQEMSEYKSALKDIILKQKELLRVFRRKKETVTKDGYRINISANISNIEECDAALANDADGIGLVRTEILFSGSGKMPDEKEQFGVYSKIARKMHGRPVVIRTSDIGEDKAIAGMISCVKGDKNSSLRGLARSLENKDLLKAQIRSIIRAGDSGNISISFPMVNNADEIREAKELIEQSKKELAAEGKKVVQGMRVGAFIETECAVENIEEILSEVDFVNIGTNDLLQQTMGVDRRSIIGGKKEYLNPGFLRIMQGCVNKAEQKKKLVYVCGEMASDLEAVPVLVGMGIRELSMSPLKSKKIRDAVRGMNLEDAALLARRVLESNSTDDAKKMISDWFSNRME